MIKSIYFLRKVPIVGSLGGITEKIQLHSFQNKKKALFEIWE